MDRNHFILQNGVASGRLRVERRGREKGYSGGVGKRSREESL
jgi:hypothetical protein